MLKSNRQSDQYPLNLSFPSNSLLHRPRSANYVAISEGFFTVETALKHLGELLILIESKEVMPLMINAFVTERSKQVAGTKAFQFISFLPALSPSWEVNAPLSDCDGRLLLQHLNEQT